MTLLKIKKILFSQWHSTLKKNDKYSYIVILSPTVQKLYQMAYHGTPCKYMYNNSYQYFLVSTFLFYINYMYMCIYIIYTCIYINTYNIYIYILIQLFKKTNRIFICLFTHIFVRSKCKNYCEIFIWENKKYVLMYTYTFK